MLYTLIDKMECKCAKASRGLIPIYRFYRQPCSYKLQSCCYNPALDANPTLAYQARHRAHIRVRYREENFTALSRAAVTFQRQAQSSIDWQTYAGQARRSSVASPLPSGCYLLTMAVLIDLRISCFPAACWV